MSADEFDPAIERLFARPTPMADAELFAADVEARLATGTRLRAVGLGVAGLIGGVIAVREVMSVDLNLTGAAPTRTVQGVQSAAAAAQDVVATGLQQTGLSGLELGSMGGMQLFWITAGALIALLAAGVVRLSQDV